MSLNYFILVGNPFFDAYNQSDYLGKLIFILLVSLSIISWVILINKFWITQQARKLSQQFWETFQLQRLNPLSLEIDNSKLKLKNSPFQELYIALKKNTLEILQKNRTFKGKEENSAYLSPTDIDFIQAQLMTQVSNSTKDLEKNLFILSTIVTLAPFLGLLGTVWGILNSFSEMQAVSSAGSQSVLSGLSLALATTVLGLLDAIPALIGYNYLKNASRDFETDMQSFSNEMIAAVELQYRQVDIN
ncbi:MAG: MotA/TolQ/ExbB proton channel family protein [Parachlamydiaceae bacterium]